MSSFEQLCRDAAAQPPSGPRLGYVQRRAARRSLTRNGLLALFVLAAPLGVWLASSTTEPDVLVVAAEDLGAEVPGTAANGNNRPVGDAVVLPDGIDGEILAQIGSGVGSSLHLDQAIVASDVIPGLDLMLLPTADGRQMCLVTVTDSDPAYACTDVEDFEQNGILFWFPDASEAGMPATVVAVPSGTLIGELGDGVSAPTGVFHVWVGDQDTEVARLVDGRLSVDLGPDAIEREYSVGPTVRFGPECEVSLRVYNGASVSGIGSRLTDQITESILAADDLAGELLEPRNTVRYEAAVTWFIDDGLDCADLEVLGLPAPSVIEQPPGVEDWQRLDPEWVGDNRVAVVLGELYRD